MIAGDISLAGLQFNQIIHSDALTALKELPDECVDVCITSPPYYNQRDYKTDGQLGREPSVLEYIRKLMQIFDQVKRVLKRTGSCWVNLGDKYDKNGDLMAIPERFVLEMQYSDWIRRNTIIWYKPNCMPSSAHDRFTVDWEYLFFFTKSPRYYFETQYEPLDLSTLKQLEKPYNGKGLKDYGGNNVQNPSDVKRRILSGIKFGGNKAATGGYGNPTYSGNEWQPNGYGRIKRAVWKIPTAPFADAHFAVFPPKLVETPIKACSKPNDIILDPFLGSGTVALVALQNARNFVGIELNQAYIDMAMKRLQPLLAQTRLAL
jgi:DNA modification methylase